ncbi:MAG: tRNA (adenosine(37)-N6)-threonylcarbamoyltransferase complex transferase subunit TsaD [Bdellovibrionales bacterium]|nr:tRNA (adenosine(37)-N6)-threonylcarbamoyltransferase complex transferase subunit TsaD [Bdellovibrionales bacterium]
MKKILAVETSCDDTSIAIVDFNGYVHGVETANQDKQHKPFGGVVPEIAGRNHTDNILPLIEKLLNKTNCGWDDLDGLVVTNRPGLVGSLLVGVITVKTLALALNKPFVAVNHLEGHLLAPFLKDEDFAPPKDFAYPFVALAVSGGHSHLYNVLGLGKYKILGKTLDDAAGEAFDKFAKLLGLGFPGGVKIDQKSKEGNHQAIKFPIGLEKSEDFNFSFSGLKSFAQRYVENLSAEDVENKLNDLCASYQEAIVDALMLKLNKAVEFLNAERAVITGGVSANSRLRARAEEWAQKKGIQIVVPPIRYCTDNAAMIGYVGIQKLNSGLRSDFNEGPSSNVYDEDFLN